MNTERPVTVRAGTNTVLGLDPDALMRVPALLAEAPPRTDPPPLWDGFAGARAAVEIESVLGIAE
jgi:UDP-N-acetylglucosamine 2-epimerase (non-hydrolysing)